MKCKHCNQEIVLVPSATERARKYGNTPEFYTSLFERHADCELELRARSLNRVRLRPLSGK